MIESKLVIPASGYENQLTVFGKILIPLFLFTDLARIGFELPKTIQVCDFPVLVALIQPVHADAPLWSALLVDKCSTAKLYHIGSCFIA